MVEIKEMDLYDSFVKLVVEFSNTFQTREEALAQRNVIEQWTELDSLYNMFIEKLNAIGKSIPEKRFLKPLIIELNMQCIGLMESAIISEYAELERCLIEPTDEPRVWCYLYPLEGAVDIIDFSGPLRIRKATILERAFYRQDKPHMGEIPFFIAETKSGNIQSLLKESRDDSTKFGYHMKLADEPPYGGDFFTLGSILRLLKPNPIGYDSLMFQENRGNLEYRATYQVSPWKHPCPLGVIRDLHLTLDDKDVYDLIELWNYYHLAISNQDMKSSARLKRAIRRYELVICSNEIEDAIVDSVIALETIFAAGEKRMAYRASKLLGANERSRERIYQILCRAHRMRNIIVHGGALRKTDDEVDRYLLSILGRILVCAIVLSKDGDWFAAIVKEAMEDKDRMNIIRKSITKWLIK